MIAMGLDTATLTRAAKWAFTTRRVPCDRVAGLQPSVEDARPGDLVLGRVASIGSHRRIQLREGRPSELYPGDLVVLCCGARYAPDQFEGLAEIGADGADMLAGGGVLGRMRARNGRMGAPTRIAPIGLLRGRDGRVINAADHALAPRPWPEGMTVIAAVGASMNAGKTTAVASLAHGLARGGFAVAAIKATGTGAFGDYNAYLDAGAHFVADFVDAGMVSTYREPLSRIEAGMDTLLGHAADRGCTVAVIELADGIFQQETAAILRDERLRGRFDGVLFASADAASVVGGTAVLRGMGIEPVLVTGMVSRSPMATVEAEAAAGVRIDTRESLLDPSFAGALLARLRTGAAPVARPVEAAA